MLWLTLSISNAENLAFDSGNALFVKDAGKLIEAKVAGRWIAVDASSGSIGNYRVAPLGQRYLPVLTPPGTEACRLHIRYTGEHLSSGRLGWCAEHLPRALRLGVPRIVWRWSGFPRYEPNSDWAEITIELPVPREPVLPPKIYRY